MKKLIEALMPVAIAAIIPMGAFLAAAFAAYGAETPAAPAAPPDTIVREYRFAEGQEPDIPERIAQFGREYGLASRSDPVPEGELPEVREYTYRIDGTLSKADLDLVQGLPGYHIEPVYFDRVLRVDRTCYYPGGFSTLAESVAAVGAGDQSLLPSNDVLQLPQSRAFAVPSAGSPGGAADVEIALAGVEFAPVDYPQGDPDYGLAAGYYAKAVYRGQGTVKDIGYYSVSVSYTKTEEGGGVMHYVVTAVYAPIGGSVPAPVPEPPDDAIATYGALPGDPQAGFTQEELDMIANQAPLSDSLLAPFINVMNGNVPLGAPDVDSAWSLLSGMLALAGIIMMLLFAALLMVALRGKDDRDGLIADGRAADGHAALMGRPFLRVCAIAFGAAAFTLFVACDDVSLPMVWIDRWTVPVAALFMGCAVSGALSRRVKADEEADARHGSGFMEAG